MWIMTGGLLVLKKQKIKRFLYSQTNTSNDGELFFKKLLSLLI